MKNDLLERQISYEKAYDYSIINRIPILIKINAVGFKKSTRNVEKPFCNKTSLAMNYAMLESSKRIDSAVFSYTYSDKIYIILWYPIPDDKQWLDNKIQKISSRVSSMVTFHFFEYLAKSEEPPDLVLPVTFESIAVGIPNIAEVINSIILAQQTCISKSVYELLKHNGFKKFNGKKLSERINILKEEFNIDYNNISPAFRNGVSCYKAPKIFMSDDGVVSKTKWVINIDTPNIIKERMFLLQILTSGSDILRPERDLP